MATPATHFSTLYVTTKGISKLQTGGMYLKYDTNGFSWGVSVYAMHKGNIFTAVQIQNGVLM